MAWNRGRSLVAGVGCLVLAAVVFLCPLTAVAAPAAGSGCHDRPAPDHHGETSAAFVCCAAVDAAPAAQVAAEAEVAAASPAAVRPAPHPVRRAGRHRPESASPPLFVRYSSLLL